MRLKDIRRDEAVAIRVRSATDLRFTMEETVTVFPVTAAVLLFRIHESRGVTPGPSGSENQLAERRRPSTDPSIGALTVVGKLLGAQSLRVLLARKLCAILLGSLTLLVLASCSLLPPRTPEPSEMVGVWVNNDHDGVRSSLILSENGRFTAIDVPVEVFGSILDPHWDESLDWSDLVSLTGTWKIVDKGRSDSPSIEIDIEARAGHQGLLTYLGITDSSGVTALSYSYGPLDNDTTFTFEKG